MRFKFNSEKVVQFQLKKYCLATYFMKIKKVKKCECFKIKYYYKSLKAHTNCVSNIDITKTIELYCCHRCSVHCIYSKCNPNQIHTHLAEIFSVTLNCNHNVYLNA